MANSRRALRRLGTDGAHRVNIGTPAYADAAASMRDAWMGGTDPWSGTLVARWKAARAALAFVR